MSLSIPSILLHLLLFFYYLEDNLARPMVSSSSKDEMRLIMKIVVQLAKMRLLIVRAVMLMTEHCAVVVVFA